MTAAGKQRSRMSRTSRSTIGRMCEANRLAPPTRITTGQQENATPRRAVLRTAPATRGHRLPPWRRRHLHSTPTTRRVRKANRRRHRDRTGCYRSGRVTRRSASPRWSRYVGRGAAELVGAEPGPGASSARPELTFARIARSAAKSKGLVITGRALPSSAARAVGVNAPPVMSTMRPASSGRAAMARLATSTPFEPAQVC
jgi:hypothetical protein